MVICETTHIVNGFMNKFYMTPTLYIIIQIVSGVSILHGNRFNGILIIIEVGCIGFMRRGGGVDVGDEVLVGWPCYHIWLYE